MRRFLTTVFLPAIFVACMPAGVAQLVPSSPQQLMKDVTYNEVHDKERNSFWSYRIQQHVGGQTFIKHQVETQDGPIFRILEEDGKPLSGERERKEEDRLNDLLSSPGALAKNRSDHMQDEERVQRMITLMPEAFLFEQQGAPSGDLVTYAFRPDPAFKPPTYEARVFHGMAGTVVVNQRMKRLVEMKGTVINRIDFGYGLLGYVDKGGVFEIHREQVSNDHWKTDLVDVHVAGRVILLKTVSKDHHEARSQFQPVSTSISLTDAKRLLDQAASEKDVAGLSASMR